MGISRATVIHQHQALAFPILEIQGEAPVAQDGLLVDHAFSRQMLAPPGDRALPRDAERRPDDAVGAPALGWRRPVEEGHVGAGRADAVGVEQVVGRDIVLIHRLLHEPQPEAPRVEGRIVGGPRGDGGEVMKSGEVHQPVLRMTRER